MGLAQLAQNGVSQLSSADPYEGLDKLKEASVGKMNDATIGKAKKAGEGARNDMGGQAKDGVAGSIPGDGLLKGKSGGVDAVGKARRMPAQQSTDIDAPLTTVYNQFTQFEEWPDFMHRVESVSQGDESHLTFKVRMWTRTRDFTEESTGQRPGGVDRVEDHRGHLAHWRGHLPRAHPAPDARRGQL